MSFIVDNYFISFKERLSPFLSKCLKKCLREKNKAVLLERWNLGFNSYTIGFRWVNIFFILTLTNVVLMFFFFFLSFTDIYQSSLRGFKSLSLSLQFLMPICYMVMMTTLAHLNLFKSNCCQVHIL